MLLSIFQGVLIVDHFNLDGFSGIHCFATASRRMVVSASLVFRLFQVASWNSCASTTDILCTGTCHIPQTCSNIHHKFAIVQADDFKNVMENEQLAIQQMNKAMASNRQKLASILKVIVLCR